MICRNSFRNGQHLVSIFRKQCLLAQRFIKFSLPLTTLMQTMVAKRQGVVCPLRCCRMQVLLLTGQEASRL